MSCEAYSKAHCSHFYCLDKVVVDMIADSSTTNVIDFCNANPNLHQFSLTCRTEDCEEIISIVNNNALTNRQKKYALQQIPLLIGFLLIEFQVQLCNLQCFSLRTANK